MAGGITVEFMRCEYFRAYRLGDLVEVDGYLAVTPSRRFSAAVRVSQTLANGKGGATSTRNENDG